MMPATMMNGRQKWSCDPRIQCPNDAGPPPFVLGMGEGDEVL